MQRASSSLRLIRNQAAAKEEAAVAVGLVSIEAKLGLFNKLCCTL
jgi:hypothetical protein